MIKDINKYVLEYDVCQKERLNRKLEIEQEISRLKEI